MERRKDPVLKKIVLLCSVAALVAIYCFSAYSELSQLPTNLSVNEEEARSIMESRALRLVAPSEDEGIPDLKINGIAPLYDAETSTFYYSLSDDSRRWPSLHFTSTGRGGRPAGFPGGFHEREPGGGVGREYPHPLYPV